MQNGVQFQSQRTKHKSIQEDMCKSCVTWDRTLCRGLSLSCAISNTVPLILNAFSHLWGQVKCSHRFSKSLLGGSTSPMGGRSQQPLPLSFTNATCSPAILLFLCNNTSMCKYSISAWHLLRLRAQENNDYAWILPIIVFQVLCVMPTRWHIMDFAEWKNKHDSC